MKTLRFLILGLTCVFGTISIVTAQDECTAYFPMTEGAEFEITNYDQKGKEVGRAEHTVTEVAETSGGMEVKVSSTLYDKKDKEVTTMEYIVKCQDGMYQFDMSGFMNSQMQQMDMEASIEGDFLEIPSDPMVGQRLDDGKVTMNISDMMSMTTEITDRVVEGKETVETPAGSFDCVIISSNTETKMMMTVSSSSKDWYAKDVGMVKSEYYDKKGKMSGYSLLTKFSK